MNDTLTTTEARPAREARSNGDQPRYLTPRVNIYETKDGYSLEAELPGVTKSGLDILLENNELTLVGQRQTDKIAGDPVYRESSPYAFRRVFTLDPSIDTSKVEANLENGLLTLNLPKAERVKPRRITVSD